MPQQNMYYVSYFHTFICIFSHLYMHIFTPLEEFSKRWQRLGFKDSYMVCEGVDFEYYVFEGP